MEPFYSPGTAGHASRESRVPPHMRMRTLVTLRALAALQTERTFFSRERKTESVAFPAVAMSETPSLKRDSTMAVTAQVGASLAEGFSPDGGRRGARAPS